MNGIGQPDRLIVINGPEDGAEFPIERAPFTVGSSPDNAAHLRTDALVRATHAQFTAMADGYRVRGMDGLRVLVDGKGVGVYRSRILRHGSVARVGHTLLCLDCAPNGLASRSRDVRTQGDIAWAARQIATWLRRGVRDLAHGLRWLVRRILGNWGKLLILAAIAMWLSPPFRYWVMNLLRGPLWHAQRAVRWILDQTLGR